MMTKPRYPLVKCSFCGKGPEQVGKLITGPSVHICNECVEMCNEILREDRSPAASGLTIENLPTPGEMKAFIDQYVIGQDDAKRGVCVAAYNHYKRLLSRADDEGDGVEIDKSNILMIGPTGTGKTLVAQTLARLLRVPFTIVDATIFTEAGYVGEDVENMLVRLIQAANYDIVKAEKGIIYVDEFDKIGRKSANPSITRDVSGEGVQQAMLKILEGTVSSIPPKGGRKHPEQSMIQVNTRDILFICGGSFEGLEKIIEARIGESRMGFNAELRRKDRYKIGETLRKVEPDDLIRFGMIPEIVGRLPTVLALDELDEDALLRILTEPKNALTRQYQKLLAMEDIRLVFAREALRETVRIAYRKKTGARGLRSVLEASLVPVMFETPARDDIREIIVTREAVLRQAPPAYILKKDKKIA
ncbi:MAG: ATP-dependent Clp protease ATP-binding subunit ClpX [Chitinispirillaceae bacterium]|nr:ATP-dependent Clp protease ATP-binding subunit ClpX [Chitinispirillaceae bacterium]